MVEMGKLTDYMLAGVPLGFVSLTRRLAACRVRPWSEVILAATHCPTIRNRTGIPPTAPGLDPLCVPQRTGLSAAGPPAPFMASPPHNVPLQCHTR